MSLPIVNRIPAPDHELQPDQDIEFTIDGSVILDSVLISIDDVLIYSHQTPRGGYAVTRTPLPDDQTQYVITPPDVWPYNETITVSVYAEQDAWWYRWFTGQDPMFMDAYGEGEPMGIITSRWDLLVAEDPTCFIGPINSFEQALLLPYASCDTRLRATEELRELLLDYAISRPKANRAVRWILLRAHSSELAPVLRTLVPTPTSAEATVRLCNQRSNVDIDAALRGKPGLLPAVLDELSAFGLPPAYRTLLQRYDIDDANARVPLSCLAVCLAKVFETAQVG
jgi:hypothetical protein